MVADERRGEAIEAEGVRELAVVGYPCSAGAYSPGQEKAPAVWRRHGLLSALTERGRRVVDTGDAPLVRWRLDREHPEAMNVDDVARGAGDLAVRVADALDGDRDVLVLGGDCTAELGTVAGALRSGEAVGLVYIDLDVDLKVPATGDGALDWMGVAHLLGVDGAVPQLTALGPRSPALSGDAVLPFACANITDSEADLIDEHGLTPVPLQEVRADPTAAADRAVAWGSRFDRLLVHVDIDVLRWTDFPIAENTRREDGLTLDELTAVLARLLTAPNWRALTLCEINPDHAPVEADTFGVLVTLLADLLAAESAGRRLLG